jgi:predicted RecA/RadA family phage recombinase
MSATLRSGGQTLQYTNGTGATITVNTVVILGNFLGIVEADIANLAVGTLLITGEHELAATAAEVWKQGDDLFWDRSTSKLTLVGGKSNLRAGKAAAAKAATVAQGLVLLNDGNNMPWALVDRVWEDVAADLTADAQDVGKVLNVTVTAKVITLPATAAGLAYVVRNGGADLAILVTVSPNANDKIMGADLAGVNDKDRLNTAATARRGDYIVLLADGVDGWFVLAERGVWAAQA